MRFRSFRMLFPTLLCISFIILPVALSACDPLPSPIVSSQTPIPTIATSTVNQAQNNLPFPFWWDGVCDANNYVKSNDNPQQLTAYTLPKDKPPANYRGVVACGPRHIGDNAPNVTVSFPENGEGEYEWQCVELSMRFMYLAYGIRSYDAPTGDVVVDNYTDPQINPKSNNPILVRVPNDGKSQTAPQPGDILSYNSADSPNHTSVVIDTNVESTGINAGSGEITVLEQNFSPTGTATLYVGTVKNKSNEKPWVVAGIKNWLHHTLDITPQTASPGSIVTISGTGFGANEQVAINFDEISLPTKAVTDSKGILSTLITIPMTAHALPSSNTVQVIGQTSNFSPQTVFYLGSAATPTATPSLIPTATPPTPILVPTPTPSPTNTPTPIPSPTATAIPAATPTPTPSPRPGPTATPTPTPVVLSSGTWQDPYGGASYVGDSVTLQLVVQGSTVTGTMTGDSTGDSTAVQGQDGPLSSFSSTDQQMLGFVVQNYGTGTGIFLVYTNSSVFEGATQNSTYYAVLQQNGSLQGFWYFPNANQDAGSLNFNKIS